MILTFLTGFGNTDSYVARMKGVVLGIKPEVKLIDTTHNPRPHQVGKTAWVLGRFRRFHSRGIESTNYDEAKILMRKEGKQ